MKTTTAQPDENCTRGLGYQGTFLLGNRVSHTATVYPLELQGKDKSLRSYRAVPSNTQKLHAKLVPPRPPSQNIKNNNLIWWNLTWGFFAGTHTSIAALTVDDIMSVGCQTRKFWALLLAECKKSTYQAKKKKQINLCEPRHNCRRHPGKQKGKHFVSEKKKWEVKVKENHHIIAISGVGLVAASTSHAENPQLTHS